MSGAFASVCHVRWPRTTRGPAPKTCLKSGRAQTRISPLTDYVVGVETAAMPSTPSAKLRLFVLYDLNSRAADGVCISATAVLEFGKKTLAADTGGPENVP